MLSTPIGFVNYKANCWANAVLQALISIPENILKIDDTSEVAESFKSLRKFITDKKDIKSDTCSNSLFNKSDTCSNSSDTDNKIDEFLASLQPPKLVHFNDDIDVNDCEDEYENLPEEYEYVPDGPTDDELEDEWINPTRHYPDGYFLNKIDGINLDKDHNYGTKVVDPTRNYYHEHLGFRYQNNNIRNNYIDNDIENSSTDKNIEFLKTFIKSLNSDSFGNSQEDVTEFLYLFIDKLKLDEIFRLYYNNTGYCSNCMSVSYNSKDIMCIFNHTSEIFSEYKDLQYVITNNHNNNDAYNCEKCKVTSKLIQQNTLTSAGDCIIISHFKDLKEKKNIPSYINILEKNYKLVAAIYHYGSINSVEQYKRNGMMNFGHYYAKCVRDDICYKFDDDLVTMDNFLLNTENIYLTFYVKV